MTLLLAALGLAAAFAVLSVAPHLLARKDGAGCEGDGVVYLGEGWCEVVYVPLLLSGASGHQMAA